MSKYLITGGLGFIGSHLSHALYEAGHSVRILDDLSTGRRENAARDSEVLVGSVVDSAAVAHAFDGVEGCFHLAAIASVERSNKAWAACHRVNLGGTVNVLEAARDAGGVPVVYASSAAVYGDQSAGRLTEGAATRPQNSYGADKLGGEFHADVASRLHGVPTTALRFFNVYGPGQDPDSPYSGVISIFAKRIMSGESVVIHGDGSQSRDFVYVGDVVNFLMTSMATPSLQRRLFNVCTGQATSISELFQVLCDVFGRRVQVLRGPARPGDIQRSLGDPSHAEDDLGVAALTSLRSGLAATFGVTKVVAGGRV